MTRINEEITIKHRKEASLKHSIKDGSFFSIMFGFGENYVSPFAIALKATAPQIAFLTSIPQLAASLFQLLAAKVTDWYQIRKKIIFISAFVQALVWFPLFMVPYLTKNIVFLIFFFTIYWIAGYFGLPAWNSWMGDLVDENQRGRYFGLRNKVVGFFAFSSIFAAGFILDAFTKINPFLGFGVIFFIALIARLISANHVRKMYEPKYIIEKKDYFSFPDFIKRVRNTNYGRFVLFISFFRFAVSIASPFFVVYILRDLNFSYATYTLIIGAATVTSFLTMTYWGAHGDKFGNKKILTVTSLIIPFIPMLWLVSTNIKYLIALQLFGGFAWAGFNLSSANFIFDAVPAPKRARCNAYFNVFNGIAIFLGASFGGWLALIIKTPNLFISNLLVIFLISGLLRLAFALLFLPSLREERKVEFIPGSRFMFQVVAVDPVKGLMYESVTGMKVIEKIGKFSFMGLKTSVKTITKVVKDIDSAIKKRRKLMVRQMFVPKKPKGLEPRELKQIMKQIDKKIKRNREIKEDYMNEPE